MFALFPSSKSKGPPEGSPAPKVETVGVVSFLAFMNVIILFENINKKGV